MIVGIPMNADATQTSFFLLSDKEPILLQKEFESCVRSSAKASAAYLKQETNTDDVPPSHPFHVADGSTSHALSKDCFQITLPALNIGQREDFQREIHVITLPGSSDLTYCHEHPEVLQNSEVRG